MLRIICILPVSILVIPILTIKLPFGNYKESGFNNFLGPIIIHFTNVVIPLLLLSFYMIILYDKIIFII